jgi:hypothetical protein
MGLRSVGIVVFVLCTMGIANAGQISLSQRRLK